MKNARKWCTLLLLCMLAVVLGSRIVREQTPENISFGTVEDAGGSWSQTDQTLEFSCPLSSEHADEQVLLLQSHWPDYDIAVDHQTVYSAAGGQTGPVHLFLLPAGNTLTIRFFCESSAAVQAIQQSKILVGDRGGMYQKLIRENLYAILFAAFAVILSIVSIYVGFRMKGKQTDGLFKSLLSLGAYVLCAGIWVLTDSRILLLITQRSGLVELISFIAFFTLPIPLLQFSKSMFSAKKGMLEVLQHLFAGMLLLFAGNHMWRFMATEAMLVAEHVLMAVTIMLMLYSGFQELRRRRNKKLLLVVIGYVVFCLCSLIALLFFYLGNSLLYSKLYVLGILGFILLLADSAWIAVYEQIQQNANVAVYAKMAYLDMMTGMGNRAAFMKEVQQSSAADALAYIVVDINNLKKVNDELGHQKGDELIVQISDCIKRAVTDGSCYRIGGDEFVISLKGADRETVLACTARIRKEIQDADAQNELPISAALGCAWSGEPAADPDAIFRQADHAMYEEKRRMKVGRDA